MEPTGRTAVGAKRIPQPHPARAGRMYTRGLVNHVWSIGEIVGLLEAR
jgi:hypothetical protein